MKAQLLALFWLVVPSWTRELLPSAYAQNNIRWSCYINATGMAFDMERMSGYWYEAARVPNVDVLQCLNVSAPATLTENGDYQLQLEYINTVTGKGVPTRENVSFPWDDYTKNGIFNLHYSSDFLKLTVTYKLVYTDYRNIVLLCGYTGMSPIPLFKLMTRQRELDPALLKLLDSLLAQYPLGSQVVWEEQSPDRCNGASSIAGVSLLTIYLSLAFGLSRLLAAWRV